MKNLALFIVSSSIILSGCLPDLKETQVSAPVENASATALPPTATPVPAHPCLAGGEAPVWLTPRAFTISYTPDGLRIYRPYQALSAALLVDGVEVDKQNALLYYLEDDGYLKIAKITAEEIRLDGKAFIEGNPARGLSDVDLYRMEDGSIRMLTLVNTKSAAYVCLMESWDGQNFTLLENPLMLEAGGSWRAVSFIQLTDRSWLLAAQGGDVVRLWRSPDGIVYIPFNDLNLGEEPEFSLALRGKVRLYLNQDGVVAYTSEDAGEKWKKEKAMPFPEGSGAPAYIPITRLMVYAQGE